MPTIPASRTVGALGDDAVAQAPAISGACGAHVAAEADPQLGDGLVPQIGEHPGERATEQEVDLPVHLLAVEAADVVGLEDLGRDLSIRTCPAAPRSCPRATVASRGCRRARA